MAELLPNLGKNRIFYRAAAFKDGLIVTANILDPNLEEINNIEFVPIGKGFYYYDYYFNKEGTYLVNFYENGIQMASQAYLVQLIVSSSTVYKGSNVMG